MEGRLTIEIAPETTERPRTPLFSPQIYPVRFASKGSRWDAASSFLRFCEAARVLSGDVWRFELIFTKMNPRNFPEKNECVANKWNKMRRFETRKRPTERTVAQMGLRPIVWCCFLLRSLSCLKVSQLVYFLQNVKFYQASFVNSLSWISTLL